jgi:hypothetical protein
MADEVWLPQPLATFTSIARTNASLPNNGGTLREDRVYTIHACLGSCVDNSASPAVSKTGASATSDLSADARVVTPAGWGFTVLAAVTYDFNLSSAARSDAFFDYEWRPIALSPAAEVFQLQRVTIPLQSFAGSFVFTLMIPESRLGRFGAGFGVTMLFGTGTNGFLTEFTGDVVWSPPFPYLANRVFLVLGFGERLFNDLIIGQVGDTVALARTNGSNPTAPTVSTQTSATPVASLGIGINLSVISDAIASLLKGGSK